MYRSRGDGEQNASVGKRQENDDFADSVYELYGKVPIYAFFSAVFFPDYAALVMIGLYVLGIVMGIIMALLFKGTMFKGEPVPFCYGTSELPSSGNEKCRTVIVGKSERFSSESFYGYFRGDDRDLVLAKL